MAPESVQLSVVHANMGARNELSLVCPGGRGDGLHWKIVLRCTKNVIENFCDYFDVLD